MLCILENLIYNIKYCKLKSILDENNFRKKSQELKMFCYRIDKSSIRSINVYSIHFIN